MVVNNNTNLFLASVFEEAQNDIKKIETETKQYIESSLNALEKETKSRFDNWLERQKQDIISEVSSSSSFSREEYRFSSVKKREELLCELKNAVIKKLENFCKTEEYNAFLQNSLKGIENPSDATVYVKESDKYKLNEKDYCGVVVDNTILLGGIKYLQDGIIYDNSLDTRLETAMQNFRTMHSELCL